MILMVRWWRTLLAQRGSMCVAHVRRFCYLATVRGSVHETARVGGREWTNACYDMIPCVAPIYAPRDGSTGHGTYAARGYARRVGEQLINWL